MNDSEDNFTKNIFNLALSFTQDQKPVVSTGVGRLWQFAFLAFTFLVLLPSPKSHHFLLLPLPSLPHVSSTSARRESGDLVSFARICNAGLVDTTASLARKPAWLGFSATAL